MVAIPKWARPTKYMPSSPSDVLRSLGMPTPDGPAKLVLGLARVSAFTLIARSDHHVYAVALQRRRRRPARPRTRSQRAGQ
eukprot:240971-Pyramimonas_sp.AAC.1